MQLPHRRKVVVKVGIPRDTVSCILLVVVCSGQSPVPMLVRPPPADDVTYNVVAEQLEESVEQQSLSVHAATTSRLVIVILSLLALSSIGVLWVSRAACRNKRIRYGCY